VQVVDANTIHITTKKAGKTLSDQIRTASPDGKMMTLSITCRSPKSDRQNNVDFSIT
jgi:hypothetical protein